MYKRDKDANALFDKVFPTFEGPYRETLLEGFQRIVGTRHIPAFLSRLSALGISPKRSVDESTVSLLPLSNSDSSEPSFDTNPTIVSSSSRASESFPIQPRSVAPPENISAPEPLSEIPNFINPVSNSSSLKRKSDCSLPSSPSKKIKRSDSSLLMPPPPSPSHWQVQNNPSLASLPSPSPTPSPSPSASTPSLPPLQQKTSVSASVPDNYLCRICLLELKDPFNAKCGYDISDCFRKEFIAQSRLLPPMLGETSRKFSHVPILQKTDQTEITEKDLSVLIFSN